MKRFKNIVLALMMGAGISASAAFVYNASFIGTSTASATETSGAPVVRQVQSSATSTTLMAGQSTTALNSNRGAILQNSQAVSSPEEKKAPSGGCANCTGCNSQCMNNRN